MSLEPIPAGQPIRASWIARLVALVVRGLKLSAAFPLRWQQDESGAHLALAWWFELKPFELVGPLGKGSQAPALLLEWDRTSEQYRLPAAPGMSDRLTVYDMVGTFTGRAGDRGYAFFSRTSGRWEIVQLEC